MRVGIVLLLLYVTLAHGQRYAPNTTCEWNLRNMTGLTGPYPDALLMKDASAKGTLGVYIGFHGLIDPGKWDECNRLPQDIAHYCFLHSGLPIPTTTHQLPTNLGICVPSSCTEDDLSNIPYTELHEILDLPSLGLVLDAQRTLTAICPTAPTWGDANSAFVTVMVVLVAMETYDADKVRKAHSLQGEEPVYVDTSIESVYYTEGEDQRLLSDQLSPSRTSEASSAPVYQDHVPFLELLKQKPSEMERGIMFNFKMRHLVLCWVCQFAIHWSLLSNFASLWKRPSRSRERFQFLHGVKALFSVWSVMGLTIFYVTLYGWVNVEKVAETESTFLYQLYANSSVYTADGFWMISALLMSYFTLSTMQQRPIRAEATEHVRKFYQFFNVPLYVLRRLLRLWPSLIMAVFFYWKCSWVFGSGPFWPWYHDFVENQCSDSWWSPLFFVSSVYPHFTFDMTQPLDGCFSWGWWVSVELICFLTTPILLFLYYWKRSVGCSVVLALAGISMLVGFILCWANNLSVGLGQQTDSEHGEYFDIYYSKPYNRAHSYYIGMLLAFLLQEAPVLRVPHIIRLIAYAVVWPGLWSLFFITYDAWQGEGWDDLINILFAGLHHPLFSILFAMSLYLMCLGYEGPLHLRSFLAHPIWIPFSRLSYGVYLYVPMIAIMVPFANQVSEGYTDMQVVFMFLVNLVLAYGASLLQYVLIERPLINSFDFVVDLFRAIPARRG